VLKKSGSKLVLSILLAGIMAQTISASPARIKDVAKVVGLSDMQVIGYGLVIGLDGSGDRNLQTARIASQSMSNMLERFGLTLSPDALRLRNVAAVMVTASVPPFIETGSNLDVTVSSLGDATSLQGGTLLMTPLMSPDGRAIYAQAQGPVTVGGFSAESGLGDRIKKNHTQVGIVVNGATMAQSRSVELVRDNALALSLNNPDFTTALNLSERINQHFNESLAVPRDQSTIEIQLPADQAQNAGPVAFIAALETLQVEVDIPAKVVINERTGTIVAGTNVRLSAAAISQGNLTVEIQQQPLISQPAPFSPQGQTVVVPNAQLQVDENEEDKDAVSVLQESATVGDVASALNALGVKPRDLIAIFQALKVAGALQAEIVIM